MAPRLAGFRFGLGSVLTGAIVVLAGLIPTPAAASPGKSGPKHPSRSHGDAYVLSIGNSTTISNASLDEVVGVQARRAGGFLWFRRAGREYVIEDPATLKEARDLFAPMRALEPEQEALRLREEALDDRQEELDRQQEEIDRQMDGDDDDDNDEDDAVSRAAFLSAADRAKLDARLDEIRARQKEVRAAGRELERVERDLDAREEALEREAESKLWTLLDGAVRKGAAKPA